MATAEDVATRPICKCHGEPKIKDGFRDGKQAWQCRVIERARQKTLYSDSDWAAKKRAKQKEHWVDHGSAKRKAQYWERKDRGVCTKCGGPLLSSALCWDCLNYHEQYSMLGGL
jgi:hypothetical protein